MWLTCHQVVGWSPQGMVSYQRRSVDLCCWQIGHSAVAVARSPWWVEVCVAEPMYNLHPSHYSYFVYKLIGLSEERGWLVSTEWVSPSNWFFKSSAEVTLWWAFTWETNIFTFLAYSERSVYIHLPQIFLSPVFTSFTLNQGMSSISSSLTVGCGPPFGPCFSQPTKQMLEFLLSP